MTKITKDKLAEIDRDVLMALRLVFKDESEIYFNDESDVE